MRKLKLSGKLGRGKVALVDGCDYDFLMQWKWCLKRSDFCEYAIRTARKGEEPKTIRMHRVIAERAGLDMSNEIDHRDNDGLNNQRFNLRPATHQQNMQNGRKRKNNRSGYIGVDWYSRPGYGRWRWQIQEGNQNARGYCKTVEQAARAYDKKAREWHGEFAVLNFP